MWQVVEISKELSVLKITLTGGLSRKYELCTQLLRDIVGLNHSFSKAHGGKNGLRASVLN